RSQKLYTSEKTVNSDLLQDLCGFLLWGTRFKFDPSAPSRSEEKRKKKCREGKSENKRLKRFVLNHLEQKGSTNHLPDL
ncbi:unnamed protein product, partial [Pleuronectes platessa]